MLYVLKLSAAARQDPLPSSAASEHMVVAITHCKLGGQLKYSSSVFLCRLVTEPEVACLVSILSHPPTHSHPPEGAVTNPLDHNWITN